MHRLYLNERLEHELSAYFKQAFNSDLIVNRLGGTHVYLHIGERPEKEGNEDRLSFGYNQKIKNLPLLQSQGDGMRSFASITLELISSSNSILFIDEPEAFLHPPQARLLGKLIGKLFDQRQIFISTHSSDFIKGILESNSETVKIIRINRE
ncbi:MAG: AAA family ATPase, partial [Segetibacter sp.]